MRYGRGKKFSSKRSSRSSVRRGRGKRGGSGGHRRGKRLSGYRISRGGTRL